MPCGSASAMRRQGFNIFAFGPSGTGKHTLVQDKLAAPRRRGAAAAGLVLCQQFHRSAPAALPQAAARTGAAAARRHEAARHRIARGASRGVRARGLSRAPRSHRRAVQASPRGGLRRAPAQGRGEGHRPHPHAHGPGACAHAQWRGDPARRIPAPDRRGARSHHRRHRGAADRTRGHGAAHSRLGTRASRRRAQAQSRHHGRGREPSPATRSARISPTCRRSSPISKRSSATSSNMPTISSRLPPKRRPDLPPMGRRARRARRTTCRPSGAIRSMSWSTIRGRDGAPIVYEDDPTHQNLSAGSSTWRGSAPSSPISTSSCRGRCTRPMAAISCSTRGACSARRLAGKR